jgi:N4-gp56 family major capsid protein
MPINVQSQFSADIENFIATETLRKAQRHLVVYAFGEPVSMPEGRGLTYTMTRFNYLPLPQAPLAEGVPPPLRSMTIDQVSAVVQQWGDAVGLTDVAELTIKHPLVQQAEELIGHQVAQTLERNTFNGLNAGTQVAYAGSVGARASLTATSYLNKHDIERIYSLLVKNGTPFYEGYEGETVKIDLAAQASKNRKAPVAPHLVAVSHPFPLQDLREESSVAQAWSYSDINRIYDHEVGQLSGVRFVQSNMVPSWTGVAAITGVAGTSGNLATGTYYVQVTASDDQFQFEERIYQISGGIAVTGPNGSISVTLPALPGFTFNVYIALDPITSPVNLGTSPQGPLTGSMIGQATQLAPAQTVTITGIGALQTPPAAPATGITVYPVYIFGKSAYAQVTLDDVRTAFMGDPTKSDPLNQLRLLSWKVFYGFFLKQPTFMVRLETTASNTGAFA